MTCQVSGVTTNNVLWIMSFIYGYYFFYILKLASLFYGYATWLILCAYLHLFEFSKYLINMYFPCGKYEEGGRNYLTCVLFLCQYHISSGFAWQVVQHFWVLQSLSLLHPLMHHELLLTLYKFEFHYYSQLHKVSDAEVN